MKRSAALLLPLLLVLALAISACGKGSQPTGSSNSATVNMTATNFETKSVTIPAGGTVTFVDPTAAGAVHIICLGQNQSCSGDIKNGPPELSDPKNPVQFNAGDKKTYTFPTKGTFPVTCTVHSTMDMTVTVQ